MTQLEQIQALKNGFDLLSDHVVITDTDSHILYANKAVENKTGYSHDEIIGKRPGDLWGGAMPKEFYEKMWQTIKMEKKPFVGEVQNKKKDGTVFWQELHITPVLDASGEVKFFIGIEPDITDKKEKEKFRDEFISILSHQLKSPLSAMQWTLELLADKSAMTEEQQKQALENMYKKNATLIDLITDLVIIARAGNPKGESTEFDLAVELQAIVDSVKDSNRRVSFWFQKDEGAFILRANQPLAREVFTNLIANAAEYSDKAAGEVKVALKKEGNDFVFSCENNGTVIPKEDQTKIFSKLFRASNAPARKEKGTGLGLFIVKMICDNFGWQVSFQSPRGDGAGTVFFVRITPGVVE